MTDYLSAVDSIFALFKVDWEIETAKIFDGDDEDTPAIYWQGIEEPIKPDPSKYFARISQQTIDETQTAFADSNSKKRFQNDGLVFVQLYCPKTDSQAFDVGRQLAVIARNIFRGKATSTGVWFRNARIKELLAEEGFHRFNVIAEYQFDEIGD